MGKWESSLRVVSSSYNVAGIWEMPRDCAAHWKSMGPLFRIASMHSRFGCLLNRVCNIGHRCWGIILWLDCVCEGKLAGLLSGVGDEPRWGCRPDASVYIHAIPAVLPDCLCDLCHRSRFLWSPVTQCYCSKPQVCGCICALLLACVLICAVCVCAHACVCVCAFNFMWCSVLLAYTLICLACVLAYSF